MDGQCMRLYYMMRRDRESMVVGRYYAGITSYKGAENMANGYTVLVVDDECHILELLRFNFEQEGFDVFTVATGEECLNVCDKKLPDIIILDLMLPGIDGLEVCRILRQNQRTKLIPIIMLTAKGTELDKVIGLELGADDYVTKPFSVRELVARAKAQLRRTDLLMQPTNDEVPIIAGPLTIDSSSYEVFKDGEKLDLTLKEFELLKMLVLNKGKVLTRDAILDNVWGYDYYGDTRTVDVHIRNLRKKIGQDSDFIETVRGVGYKFSLNGDI